MDNVINFSDLLKSKGLKVTKHRTSVLEVLSKNTQPLSAEEIYSKLKENSISINLSSIYKILDSLSTKNVISKCILGDDNRTYYEMNTSEHKHHLICKTCKEVFPINDCPLCIYEKHLREDMDFDITEHRLEIYGYCKDCKK